MIIVETCPECGYDLINEQICTYPPIPKKYCPVCGWSWEGTPEPIVRVPFVQENAGITPNNVCNACPNNIKNSGSGACNCILGSQISY